jgi:thioredoxin-related protein
MKNIFSGAAFPALVLLIFISPLCTAQSQSNNFKKTIPPFRVQLTNGDSLFAKDIKKDVPLMLIYFSPTCEHCQEFTRNFLKKISLFGNAQILFISYLPLTDVEKFEQEFSLNKYSSIKTGTEGYAFIVQRFFNIMNFPFIALYNKKGSLIAAYRTAPAVEVLIKQFETNK